MSGHMVAGQSGQPRKSKGSVVSTTYEFPYMRQASDRTLGQIIYDSKQGKILGRTPKNWGKFLVFIPPREKLFPAVCKVFVLLGSFSAVTAAIIIIFSLNLDSLTSHDDICAPNQHSKLRKCLLNLFLLVLSLLLLPATDSRVSESLLNQL